MHYGNKTSAMHSFVSFSNGPFLPLLLRFRATTSKMMVSCRVRHVNYNIVQVEQVQRRPRPATHNLCMHAFFKQIKHLLRNVFDLNRVSVGFSVDKTSPLNMFIQEVFRILRCDPVHRSIFVVLFDGPLLLFAGLLSLD